jgi:hypothetical protein
MSARRVIFGVLGVLSAGLASAWIAVKPSTDRDWVDDQSRLAVSSFDGSTVTIENIRDFDVTQDPAVEHWDTRTYDLDDVRTVWYVVAPFETDWRGPAHAFLSFGFADGRYLSISVEARREKDEEYSMVGGLMRRFELMYVVGDEADLIGRRVLRQDDETYLYPIRATPERARALLVSMLRTANELAERPRFYGTLRNNCTTAILGHANEVLDQPIRWGPRIMLPGYSDELALRHHLIDTDGTIEQARERFRINDKARRAAGTPDFSARIRVNAPG